VVEKIPVNNSIPSHEQDRKLLARCLSGDREAAEDFVRRFSSLIWQSVRHIFLMKHLPFTRENLEDLHNTVFLQLFEQNCKKLRQYEGKNGCSLASWIRLIAVRTVLSHLRKKGVYSLISQEKRISLEEIPELKAEQVSAWSAIEDAERKRLVQDGIQNLPARDRLLMKLHFEQGLTLAEVAGAMCLSIQNAYTLKHRAIQKLKASIDGVLKSQNQTATYKSSN